jgi:3-oxoacyl-[acyl-carrier protein] reductase
MLTIDLTGRKALVCGSSQGIGRSIARTMANAGAGVTLLARNADQLKRELDQLSGDGNDVLVADFMQPDSLQAIKEQVQSGKYDILVNNAGGPPPGSVHTADWQQFEKAITMHLQTSHQLAQWVLPHMKEQHFGRMINIMSTSVKIPLDGLGVSNTVRGAVASWAKTMANELGQWGITVNNLLPGFMETGRLTQIIDNKAEKAGTSAETIAENMKQTVPVRRFGHPYEMGYLATFLASDLAGYISGTSIPVDGGRTGSI